MDNQIPEVVADALDGMYMWRAARPGVTLFGAYVGRVLLTNHRFLFLSTGATGVSRGWVFTAAGGLTMLTFRKTTTDQLDLSALRNEGSLSGRLDHITSSRVARRWDLSNYLVVETAGTSSLPSVCSFMTRVGLSRGSLPKPAPQGERHRVLQGVEKCDGCIYWHCNAACLHNARCMKAITVDAAHSMAAVLLEKFQ